MGRIGPASTQAYSRTLLAQRASYLNREEFGGRNSRFYGDRKALAWIVSEYIESGLRIGCPAVVIATPKQVGLICDDLSMRAFNVERLRRAGALKVFDAEAVLSRVMRLGRPDPAAFGRTFSSVLRAAGHGPRARGVRVYSETMDVLWSAGLMIEAMRLEALWNRVAPAHASDLHCAYSMASLFEITRQDQPRIRVEAHPTVGGHDPAATFDRRLTPERRATRGAIKAAECALGLILMTSAAALIRNRLLHRSVDGPGSHSLLDISAKPMRVMRLIAADAANHADAAALDITSAATTPDNSMSIGLPAMDCLPIPTPTPTPSLPAVAPAAIIPI